MIKSFALFLLPFAMMALTSCRTPETGHSAISQKESAKIQSVRVLDGKFAETALLTDEADMVTFVRHWSDKMPVAEQPNSRWIYKLDIQEDDSTSSRWLYDPWGYVTLLTKEVTPTYQLADVEAFNALIGAQQGNAAGTP